MHRLEQEDSISLTFSLDRQHRCVLNCVMPPGETESRVLKREAPLGKLAISLVRLRYKLSGTANNISPPGEHGRELSDTQPLINVIRTNVQPTALLRSSESTKLFAFFILFFIFYYYYFFFRAPTINAAHSWFRVENVYDQTIIFLISFSRERRGSWRLATTKNSGRWDMRIASGRRDSLRTYLRIIKKKWITKLQQKKISGRWDVRNTSGRRDSLRSYLRIIRKINYKIVKNIKEYLKFLTIIFNIPIYFSYELNSLIFI